MSELVSFGGRAVMYGRLGTSADSSNPDIWPSDLLAYRRQWEPFIAAHVALWRYLNSLFESTPAGQGCPAGIDPATLTAIDPTTQSFCASLMLTRRRIDENNPSYGIPAAWNAWAGKSAADVTMGAPAMLKWLQDVVKSVGGTYTDELLQIAKIWKLDIKLPDVPTFSVQQQIIAQIEGAYVATKGILQMAGYAAGKELIWVDTQTKALAEGLTDTVKEIPKLISNPWFWVGITAVVVVIGGAVFVYYAPRQAKT